MLKKTARTDIADKVRSLTGQVSVYEFLCPQCYPEKVKDFCEHHITADLRGRDKSSKLTEE